MLFDVDFSGPETPVVRSDPNLPRRTPSEILFGDPKVVDSFCGLSARPLRLSVASGSQGHEGVSFAFDTLFGHYRIEFDICVESLSAPPLQVKEPQLVVFVDVPRAYVVGFFGEGRLGVIDRARDAGASSEPVMIGRYELGKPIHVAIDLEIAKQTWSVSVDGAALFEHKLEQAVPSAVRVVMRGDPRNAAAFDNLVIWGENDLSSDET